MLLNPDLKKGLYFLHVPKTAGTSFRTLLENYFHVKEICRTYTIFEALKISEHQLSKFRFYRGHLGFNLINLLGYQPYTMMMLRNPVERAISHFYYVKNDIHSPFYKVINERKLTLEDFIIHVERPNFLENMQSRTLCQNADATDLRAAFKANNPQAALKNIIDKRSPLPTSQEGRELALRRLNDIEFVGLTERFDDSLGLLTHQLSLFPTGMTQPLKLNKKRDSLAEIPDHVINLLMERNTADLELYDVAQQRFENSYRKIIQSQQQAHIIDSDYLLVAQQQSNHIQLTFDEPIIGNGWHHREHFRDIGYLRWTGPGRVANLLFAIKPGYDYVITIDIVSVSMSGILEVVVLAFNDIKFETRISPCTNGYQLTGKLPNSLVCDSRYNKLSIDTGKTGVPVGAFASSYERYCGLAITGITISATN